MKKIIFVLISLIALSISYRFGYRQCTIDEDKRLAPIIDSLKTFNDIFDKETNK